MEVYSVPRMGEKSPAQPDKGERLRRPLIVVVRFLPMPVAQNDDGAGRNWVRIGPKSQEILYVSHQAPAGPRLFYEKPAILRRLRCHLRPGIKVFALCAGYAQIIARLRSPLQGFCLPKEGGSGSSSGSNSDTIASPVTLSSYSSPRSGDTTTF